MISLTAAVMVIVYLIVAGLIFWMLGAGQPALLQEIPTASGLPFVHSSFGRFVGHVVGLSAEKQVQRIDARRVVALVKNEKASGYWSELQFPRDTIGQKHSTLLSAGPNDSVSVLVRASSPRDAAACCRRPNVLLETNFQWDCLPRILTIFGTESATAQSDFAGIRGELERSQTGFAITNSSELGRRARHGNSPSSGALPLYQKTIRFQGA